MKKKGFTLVELMGVIAILGVIAVLVVPSMIKQLNNSKEEIDEVTQELFFSATSLYLENKLNEYPKIEGNVYCISLKELVEDDKLKKPILDANGNEVSLEKKIKVKVLNKNYSYSLPESCEAGI